MGGNTMIAQFEHLRDAEHYCAIWGLTTNAVMRGFGFWYVAREEQLALPPASPASLVED